MVDRSCFPLARSRVLRDHEALQELYEDIAQCSIYRGCGVERLDNELHVEHTKH